MAQCSPRQVGREMLGGGGQTAASGTESLSLTHVCIFVCVCARACV